MKKGNPPRWSIAIFKWLCNDHLSDAVLGDLLEIYDRRRLKMRKFNADLLFIANVIQFIQPFAIRKKNSGYPLNNYDMLKNYFTIAWRNMSRQKMYSGITIGGFALGLATCMVIFLFIRNELSFDKHYLAGDRIFRMYNNFTEPGQSDKWSNIQTPLAGVMRQELPDIELIARLMSNGMGNAGDNLVRRDDVLENSYEEKFAYADPELLELLEIPMVYGDWKVLDHPHTMVLTRSKAKQFFGDIDPTGKTLILDDDKLHPYTVAGVMEDYRHDSHFQYEYILTLKEFEFWEGEQTSWCCWNYEGYIKLREGVNVADFEKKLLPIRDNYLIADMRNHGNRDSDDFAKYHSFKLQPVGEIYLHPEVNAGSVNGDIKYIWMFGGIAVVILILACINFINLSTAKSANRAKEVGLRKVVGSLRKSLVVQFLSESVLYSIISFLIAVVIAWVALPSFNQISGRSIAMPLGEWWLFPVLIGCALIIGILAGLYPAFYLSAFKPINVLKGNIAKGAKGGRLRSTMVVFQFTASIILITGTFVIYRQMRFILNHDVGFDKDQVMIIEGTGPLGDRREVYKNELLKLSDVESVSVSSYVPVSGGMSEGYPFYQAGRETIDNSINGTKYRVDPDYIATMKMKLIEGRNFNPQIASDSKSMVVNEMMVRQLALKKPIGARISAGNNQVYTIIGVIEDFNARSMRAPIRPLGLAMEGGNEGAMIVRIRSKDMQKATQSIESVWHTVISNQPFRYSFLDERFEQMYEDEFRMGRIFTSFATLAIIVACLGLLALSTFVTQQRAKEISVRRVMGASVKSIFALLTSNFMKLVLISWVIGTPIAWYAMNEWLDGFTYREPIASDILILSGLIVGLIALTTVAWQSIKAAIANPVENLRQN
jgi:putative ABC transport system permease protein